MAGVGEVAALIGLSATAARLSKAVIDVASRYNNAKAQIKSFGQEVGILGEILKHISSAIGVINDDGERRLATEIVHEFSTLFDQLDVYNDKLYSGNAAGPTFRGKAKWVFQASELEYLRTRLECTKTNLLLLVTLQSLRSSSTTCQIPRSDTTVSALVSTSKASAARLEDYEAGSSDQTPHVPEYDYQSSILTIGSSGSARSLLSSILRLYESEQYEHQPVDRNIPPRPTQEPGTPVRSSMAIAAIQSEHTHLDPLLPLLPIRGDDVRRIIVHNQPFTETKLLRNNASSLRFTADRIYQTYHADDARRPPLQGLCDALRAVERRASTHQVGQLQCLHLLKLVKLCERMLNRLEETNARSRSKKSIRAQQMGEGVDETKFALIDQSVELIANILDAYDDTCSDSILRSNARVWSALEGAGLVQRPVQDGTFCDPWSWAKEHFDFVTDSESVKSGKCKLYYEREASPLFRLLDLIGITDPSSRVHLITDAVVRQYFSSKLGEWHAKLPLKDHLAIKDKTS